MDGIITLTIDTTTVLATKLAEHNRAGRMAAERAAVNGLVKFLKSEVVFAVNSYCLGIHKTIPPVKVVIIRSFRARSASR